MDIIYPSVVFLSILQNHNSVGRGCTSVFSVFLALRYTSGILLLLAEIKSCKFTIIRTNVIFANIRIHVFINREFKILAKYLHT